MTPLSRRQAGIRLEIDHEHVAIITIDRPERRNALDIASMQALSQIIDDLDDEDRLVKAVIVTGAGTEAFCSGGDLNDLSQRLSAADAEGMSKLMGDALFQLEGLACPVIAAINGYALGGGSELALACDLRIIDARAQLGFVHLRRGLIPGWGGGQRLLRAVGYARAFELLLRAEPLDADAIIALGLAMQAVPPGQALDAALALAHQIAQHDHAAVRSVKGILKVQERTDYAGALEVERAAFVDLWSGPAHAEVMRQFRERQGSKS
jgi:enoyl-CoA hydratase/carnithine racemase